MSDALLEKKEKLVDKILEDIKDNDPECLNYLYQLAREALMQRTLQDLKAFGK